MPFNRVIEINEDPERECWHEDGHAVIANHFGMPVLAIGFSWVHGENSEPYPSSWILTNGFDKEQIAVELGAGIAAEVIKLGNYNGMAISSDFQQWKALNCALPTFDEYVQQAIDILKERDAVLVRVYERLMQERRNPSHEKFLDTDQMWKQKHLTQEEFEALCSA